MENQQIQSIDTYQILEVIQEIPEWTLLKAVGQDSKNIVLMKIYFPKLKWAEEFLNEFFDRIGYLKFIEHDNLLAIEDFGKYQSAPYVVYPYHPFIFYSQSQPHRLDQTDFLNQFHKIAEAMDYLHRQEIVHGMLSPETILVDEMGNPKIFDPGLSEILKKVLIEKVENNFAFLSLSNVKYTAPELLSGGNPIRQSDIYSYGLLFYFGLFGELPFEGKGAPETAVLHIENNPSWIKRVSKILSREALNLIKNSLISQPEKRFESFQEIIKIVEHLLNSKRKTRLIVGKLPEKPSIKSPSEFSPNNAQVNQSLPESDFDKTVDDFDETKVVVKKAPQRNWTYAVIISLILVGLTAFYYLPTFKKNTLAVGLTQALTPVATATNTMVVIVPDQPTVQATNFPTEIPSSSAPTAPQTPLFIKPALEGQSSSLPLENISLDNLKYLKEFSRLGYGKPEDVDVSSDSNHFAVATSGGVFLFANNSFLKWLDPGGWASSVQFSPDGSSLAIGLKSGEIQVWDWQKEEKSFLLTGHSAKVTRLIFSKNSRHLFSASNDQNVIMWDIKGQKEIRKILAHSVPVEDIAISDDERTLVTGAGDKIIHIWDLSTSSLKPVWDFPFPGKVLAVAISSDGEYVAAGGDDGYIRQWIVRSKQPRTDPIPVKKRIWNIKYIDNDKTLFAALDDGETRTYLASRQKYEGVSLNFKIPPVDVALIKSLGLDFQAESYSDTFGNGTDKVSILWNGQVVSRGKELSSPFFDNLDHLVFSQDGKIVAAQGKRGITSVWDVDNNRIIFRDIMELPLGQPISPDSSSIAVIVPTTITSPSRGNEQVTINIFRWMSLTSPGKKEDLSETIPNGIVSYSNDGKLFISGSLTQSKVWDYESGYETESFSNKKYNCLITASANDAKIFQVVSKVGAFLDLTMDLTDQSRNICLRSQQGNLLAISNNLNLMAYTKNNGWLEAYDTISNKNLWTNNDYDAISVIAISPDGSIIAIGDPEGKLTFLDGKTGNFLYKITGNYGSLQAITFTGDGNIVATAGFDGTVRLFGVFPNK